MRVLITTQVFPPEIHPSARIVLELATALNEAGHEVTVATGFPHHPHGRLPAGHAKRWLSRETVNGVRIVRGWHFTSPSASIPVRGLVYVSQAIGTAFAALASGRPDVVINFGPPLVGPCLSLFLAKRFRVPHVPVIYDLYPDVAVETGAVRSETIIRLSRMAERWVYRGSSRIVVLSEGFRRTLVERKGVPAGKVRVIPVWIDAEEIHRPADAGAWRKSWNIPPESFVVLYAGTIGLVSGAEIMLEVAKRWVDTPGVLFLFVGAGRTKENVRKRAGGLPNVRFLDFQPREELSRMLAAADVGVVTLLPGRGRTSVPSKMLGYMAVELPVIASCDENSDSAAMVRESGCGETVPAGDAAAISGALGRFHADRPYCRRAGKLGRDFLVSRNSREVGVKAFHALLEEFAGSGANATIRA